MQASTPLSEGRASSLLPGDRPRSSKTNHGFKKISSLSSLQHPFKYWTPGERDRPADDAHAGSRLGLLKKTPSSFRSPSSFDSKMRTSPEKSTPSISASRMALAAGKGVNTPCRSEAAGDSANVQSKTPEPPSPVNPPSQSSLQWLRGSLEKNSASLSGLKASLAAVASFTPQPSPVSVVGTCASTTGSKLSSHSSKWGSKGTGQGFSSKNITTPPLFRKCKKNPQLFSQRLQLSDESDEEKKPGSQAQAADSARQKSYGPKRYASISARYKGGPPSSVSQNAVHNKSPAKVSISGLSISGAHSGQPQQHSSKRGCLPPKAPHSAKADALLPCRPASAKNQPGNNNRAGLPVKDVASDGKHCHSVLDENNGVERNQQLDAQQALQVSLHSKKRSLLSVLSALDTPRGDFYIEINQKKYHMLNLIGSGGSSKVFMMFNHRKELCAVKLVSLANVQSSVMKTYLQEVTILRTLRSCDRVVRLYDWQFKKGAVNTDLQHELRRYSRSVQFSGRNLPTRHHRHRLQSRTPRALGANTGKHRRRRQQLCVLSERARCTETLSLILIAYPPHAYHGLSLVASSPSACPLIGHHLPQLSSSAGHVTCPPPARISSPGHVTCVTPVD